MSTEHYLDDAAFELFFKEQFAPLCAWCQYKFDIDADESKEAVHNGFIKLWENRQSFSPRQSLNAYLYTVITNNCLDMLRHQKVKEKHTLHIARNASQLIDNQAIIKQDLKNLSIDIEKAVAGLPDQMRRVFELSRYEGLKYAEISATLGISIKTVETQMSRALARLRQQLAIYLTVLVTAFILNY
jgi:RNA polymerase sigma-70 factor (ECF subfamily)